MSTRIDTLWRWYAGAGLAVTLLMALLPGGGPADTVYVLVSASVVGALALGIRVHRPSDPLPWLLMLLGQGLWLVADSSYFGLLDLAGDDRYPSYPDVFYLSGYLAIAVGLQALARSRRTGRDVPGFVDAATVTVGLGLLAWVFVAEPLLRTEGTSAAVTAVSVGYVLADIVLVGALARLFLADRRLSAPILLLAASLGALILADFLSAVLDTAVYVAHPWINCLWPLSYVAWGAAALHPGMARATTAERGEGGRATWPRFVAMTTATLVAPGILAVQQLTSATLDVWTVVLGSVVLFSLVMVRMNLAIVEIAQVSRQRRELQEELRFQAEHDALTDLPNRARTLNLVGDALTTAVATDGTVAVLFVDLDGFKAVNDSHGHAAGDAVLRTVAVRLRRSVRGGDVPTRLGGDEFVVLLGDVAGEHTAVKVAERIISELSRPVAIDGGQHVRVGASVGIALGRPGTVTPEELLHQADLALYRAKADGRGRTVVFGETLHAEVARQAGMELALGQALELDQLVVHYQPIHHVRTGEVQGFEALVRWDRPGVGLLPPGEFLPVAESSDLICSIDAWVLRTATRQLVSLQEQTGLRGLTMAVNVSGRHLARPRFCADVMAAVQESGIDPHQLVLEVGETVFHDYPTALPHLRELRALGVVVSLDHFGSAHSSIGMLARLPVDIIKIPGEYVDGTSETAYRLLELMVGAAHSAGITVVGEGVERAEQLQVLHDVDCESAQGFYLGRPGPADDLPATAQARPVTPEPTRARAS